MDGVQVETLFVEHARLGLYKLHYDLHVVVLVVLSTLVYVVDKALDAQRLQDIPEVLL